MASGTTHERALERLLRFEPCPQCTYDLVTGEGERACHYYACPYLPEELDVRCPQCLYNFVTRDTSPGCGDPPTCDFALTEAPRRVENLTAWSAHYTKGVPGQPSATVAGRGDAKGDVGLRPYGRTALPRAAARGYGLR